MSLPKITERVGGYLFEWEQEQLKIEVSRILQHTDGTVKGEVVISTTVPGTPPHLHQAQFNFSSTETRDRLAKKLGERHQADWYSILEQLSVYTLDRVRRGEPVQDLASGTEVKPPRYMIEPLVIENLPNCIFGDPGAMKSTVAVVLSQVASLPWYDNVLGVTSPIEPISCLYLDWETDRNTIEWQLNMLANGMELVTSLHYRKCGLPLAQDLEQIRRHIDDTHARLIIIDSLGYATGGELKESQPALAFFGGLRQLDTTSLILAHTSKDRENNHKTIFGSMYFEAGMRNVWEIRKQQEPDEDEAKIALFNRKSPPFSKMRKPIGFKFNFTDNSMTLSPDDPKTVGEFVERMGTQTRILSALKGGLMGIEELHEALPDLNVANIKYTLSTLKKKNQVVNPGRGEWGLRSREDER